MVEWKRRIARVVAVLSIALAAGHLVQTKAAQERAVNALNETPSAIEPLAAGPETTKPRPVLAGLPQVPKVPLAVLEPPVFRQPALAAPAVADPAPQSSGDVPPQAVDACAVTFDLVSQPAAMVGLSLVAPCQTNQRVVVQQAGLAFSAMTNASGGLFVDVPALQVESQISVIFADGTRQTHSISVPELAEMRRFALQWQDGDAFELHGFEAGAGYGAPGDVWAENTRTASQLLPASQGFMTLLGDSAAPTPLLAAVYTYPADSAVMTEIVVEAPVNPSTCGRELLGQTLAVTGGRVAVQDLAVTMPDCDGAGGYLVLKNLAPGTNIAAAN